MEASRTNTEFDREVYPTLGRALRLARDEAGLTQEQVGQRVGMSRASIANIERGAQQVALHQYLLLAAAVGRDPVELLASVLPTGLGNVAVDLAGLGGLQEKTVSWVQRVVSGVPSSDAV